MFFASLAFNYAFSEKDYLYGSVGHHRKNTEEREIREREREPFLSAFIQSSLPDDMFADIRRVARGMDLTTSMHQMSAKKHKDSIVDGKPHLDSAQSQHHIHRTKLVDGGRKMSLQRSLETALVDASIIRTPDTSNENLELIGINTPTEALHTLQEDDEDLETGLNLGNGVEDGVCEDDRSLSRTSVSTVASKPPSDPAAAPSKALGTKMSFEDLFRSPTSTPSET
jgi:hypothetical protein